MSAERWANFPNFHREKLEQIRKSARYSLLKGRIPAVDHLCKSMDTIFTDQGDVRRAANRIIRETTGSSLGIGGDGVSFREVPKEGGSANFDSAWTLPILIRGRDPVNLYGENGIRIESMSITDKSNNTLGTLTFPADEKRYRAFWDEVEKKAKDDPDIKKMRENFVGLITLAGDAESQVLKEVQKSRRIW